MFRRDPRSFPAVCCELDLVAHLLNQRRLLFEPVRSSFWLTRWVFAIQVPATKPCAPAIPFARASFRSVMVRMVAYSYFAAVSMLSKALLRPPLVARAKALANLPLPIIFRRSRRTHPCAKDAAASVRGLKSISATTASASPISARRRLPT